jgi:hypothetical protein
MKKSIAATVGLCIIVLATNAFAFEYASFAKNTLLPCFHPTVNNGSAKSELIGEPKENNGTTVARVKVYYKGMIKSNSMLVEISRKEGTPVLIKATVLEDSSGTGTMSCKYTEGWQEE